MGYRRLTPPEPSLEERLKNLEEQLKEQEAAVRRLAQAQTSPRGYTNQAGAARYLGRSREYLRRLHKLGGGPERTPGGDYTFAALDRFKEQDGAN
jgi:hypothetical protein